jgi:iduronate 2-sulfatase
MLAQPFLLAALASIANTTNHNIVHVIVDDLRPELGAYGLHDRHTPNIDRLAANGTVFDRAYCQQGVCGPSRNSFLSGRRPDRSHSWNVSRSL